MKSTVVLSLMTSNRHIIASIPPLLYHSCANRVVMAKSPLPINPLLCQKGDLCPRWHAQLSLSLVRRASGLSSLNWGGRLVHGLQPNGSETFELKGFRRIPFWTRTFSRSLRTFHSLESPGPSLWQISWYIYNRYFGFWKNNVWSRYYTDGGVGLLYVKSVAVILIVGIPVMRHEFISML